MSLISLSENLTVLKETKEEGTEGYNSLRAPNDGNSVSLIMVEWDCEPVGKAKLICVADLLSVATPPPTELIQRE
ncbi:unnamed protein product [Strongylus vulgaris]|uniref:Uncharacterized protein n=1 Tax=Strongylus vulgaris TaxID=40348 RepID=A0A3P7KT69_STRVU|nr:unnamed protein product [Strongylus vulgaris]